MTPRAFVLQSRSWAPLTHVHALLSGAATPIKARWPATRTKTKRIQKLKMIEVEMCTPSEIIQERRKFKMPRSTFRVLTLNGVTTVAAIDDGKFREILFRF